MSFTKVWLRQNANYLDEDNISNKQNAEKYTGNKNIIKEI